ncbi:hypothetical protein JOC95_002008 [Bacillus tianshenii]|uniref:Uncharacterized protein n=1 Tax=Sutcliffiella tianshenii TaxID=1463404 RepID=A0ABS2NZK9_9BACI|nr:hypothetical protein [Bacillus tianshenii]MBM7620155.1 hypothetical protein [Bacillus tianshenii]
MKKIKPIIMTSEELRYECFHIKSKSGESYRIIRNFTGENGISRYSLKLFELVKDGFGSFKYAEVSNFDKENASLNPDSKDGIRLALESFGKYLILTDSNGDELHLTGCSSGYLGTGPHATHEVLNKLGFKVPMRFIAAMKEFQLSHPDIDSHLNLELEKLDSKYL